MTRGGPGRNQGRKKVVSRAIDRVVIGARCEEIRRTASAEGAMDRLDDAWQDLSAVREGIAAERVKQADRIDQLVKRGLKQSAKAELKRFAIWEKIAVAKLKQARAAAQGRKNHIISLKRYRPKPLTRQEIYEIASKEFGVSPRRVRDYWIEHNKLLARDRALP